MSEAYERAKRLRTWMEPGTAYQPEAILREIADILVMATENQGPPETTTEHEAALATIEAVQAVREALERVRASILDAPGEPEDYYAKIIDVEIAKLEMPGPTNIEQVVALREELRDLAERAYGAQKEDR